MGQDDVKFNGCLDHSGARAGLGNLREPVSKSGELRKVFLLTWSKSPWLGRSWGNLLLFCYTNMVSKYLLQTYIYTQKLVRKLLFAVGTS